MKKVSRFIVWPFLAIGVIYILFVGFADDDIRYTRIRDALVKFTNLYPQQKVYLHLDKSLYWANDVIWIKAYVVSGLDHQPDTLSTNLYVELISPVKTRVEIKRFQLSKGIGYGDFTLSDTLPEGLYQIRAYTTWMQNFDEEFFFEKNFQIKNPVYSHQISKGEANANKRKLKNVKKKNDDIDLQFMPEGGYLINGLESVVAFKAINKLGKGVDIKGYVQDEKQNRLVEFASSYKGVGYFVFSPVKNRKYVAVVNYEGKDMKYDLPERIESGVVVHMEHRAEYIAVSLNSNRHTNYDPAANELIMIGQMGGKIYYHSIIKLHDGKASMLIPKNDMPSGIIQFTVFSSKGAPLAERLVFLREHGLLKIRMSATDSSTNKGNKVVLKIDTRDEHHMPIPANLSISVTKIQQEQDDPVTDNILSNLLLCSDLNGYIEDPMDYFLLPAEQGDKALDGLMLTHGWRRFDWKKIINGEYPVIRYYEERGLTVAGKITRDFFNIPLVHSKVRMTIMDKYNDVFNTYTSDKGTFVFNNMVYYDTVHVKIEAWRPSGRRNAVIWLADEKMNEVKSYQGDYTLTTNSERSKTERRRQILKENKELQAKEKAAMEERKKNRIEGIYGEPDFVMYSEDFNMNSGNILEVLQGRVPGVQITGDRVLIRGINTLYGSNQPLFLVDGMPVIDVSSVTSIPIEDIDRVEILKGPKTAFYGSRGANGVIAVYTKRGTFMIRGKIEFTMLGYSTPREFYQPKYEPDHEPNKNYTLFWQPVVLSSEMGKAEIIFDKPSKGRYRFDIQGLSAYGHAGYYSEIISSE